MKQLGNVRSVIRELFEFGKMRKAEVGEDKVYDFSIGNPSVPAPASVNETYRQLLDSKDDVYLHGYTSAQGDAVDRAMIAENLNARFGTSFAADDLYMTCGAAASVRICLEALHEEGDEVIVLTPFFPEYRVFIESSGAKCVQVSTDPESFQPDIGAIREAITEHTKALILNSPNNPSGVVYRKEAIEALSSLLSEKADAYGHPIYLIVDEPYRELVYDAETEVPYLTKYYRDTLVCYSYSKSLSLPGERIGYVLVPRELTDARDVYAAIAGAGRALGYVCAPSLAQHVAAKCTGQVADLSIYRKNRDLLYDSLSSYGYHCVYPDGAFYLFVKALEEDAGAFCERAKEFDLLLVPADSFGTPGYLRLAYCVQTEMIERALSAFQALARAYQN